MVKEKIGVYGLGLIGGSIALKLNGAFDVIGVNRGAAAREEAARQGIAVSADVAAFAGASVVFVCVPVDCTVETIQKVHAVVGESSIITDVAGVKGMLKSLGLKRFVGGHPMAGTEHSGMKAARADLFEGANYPVIPFEACEQDIETVSRLARALGAKPIVLDADTHDRYVAEISHAPHVLAYALGGLPQGALDVAGTGFKDMTRVAHSDPAFWAQIVLGNRDNVLCALDKFGERVAAMRTAIAANDAATLTALFAEGQAGREKLERRAQIKNSE